ncbi:MAG: hypothetical protein J2P23_04985 [Microlunatus sp.]|nr:hypothetical protein [Microlunatus sp.]
MRSGVVKVVGLAGVVVLAACGQPAGAPAGPASVELRLIDGIRTDPDHRGLVVSYTGGACDGPARLVLTEGKTRIRARVMVRQDARREVCAAVGISRTVRARLAQPIGDRKVWVSGRRYVPFDGARLLVPSALPSGFGRRSETGLSAESASTPATPVVTTTWVTSFNSDPSAPTGETCPAAEGSLDVRIGPADGYQPHGRTKIGTVRIGTASADLYRDGTAKRPTSLAYIWTDRRGRVEVDNTVGCMGDRLLSKAALLRVAESLRQA